LAAPAAEAPCCIAGPIFDPFRDETFPDCTLIARWLLETSAGKVLRKVAHQHSAPRQASPDPFRSLGGLPPTFRCEARRDVKPDLCGLSRPDPTRRHGDRTRPPEAARRGRRAANPRARGGPSRPRRPRQAGGLAARRGGTLGGLRSSDPRYSFAVV